MTLYDRRQREIKDAIVRSKAKMSSMEEKYKEYEADFLALKTKAENEAAAAEQLCPRVPVTR